MASAQGSHLATTALPTMETILWRALEQAERRILEYVLDEIIAYLGASLALVVKKEQGSRRSTIARKTGRRPANHPARLLRAAAAHAVLANGRAYLETMDAQRNCRYLGIPVRQGEHVVAGFFADGDPDCPSSALWEDAGTQKSIGSMVAVALLLDKLQLENRQLDESLKVLRTRGVPSRPSWQTLVENPAAGSTREPPEDLSRLFPEIVGRSAAIRGVLNTVAELSNSDIPILLEGESGTGKELVAAAIHRLSRRSAEPFVTENCGAIPEHLVEAELFGFEIGAFTGAIESTPGLLERAHGGTLFLDEVGEMDLKMQKKFLRVLQEREVRRVGGRAPRPVDFRLISATNRVLEDLVADGHFRGDLFYRLHGAMVSMPALRERRDDIPLLVGDFAHRYTEELGREPVTFSEETMSYLRAYSWPGNVRELKNEIWRLVTATRGGTITRSRLSTRILKNQPSSTRITRPGRTLEELERDVLGKYIRDILRQNQGNLTETAKILSITRSTLYRRMEKYHIHPKRLR